VDGAGESPSGAARPPSTLPVERTTLSWVRTALALIAVCLLLLELAAERDAPVAEVLAWFGMLAAAGLGLWQRYRHDERVRRFAASGALVTPGPVLAVTGFVVGLAIAGLVLVLRP